MPKVDLSQIEQSRSTGYPQPYSNDVAGRLYRRIGQATGLTDIGISHCVLEPGAWSSQRHWHTGEDEFVYILSGEVVLVTDGGEEVLRAGDCAGFKANDGDGHHLQNRSGQDVVLLEIGSRVPTSTGHYSDIDMMVQPGTGYTHRDGAPYPKAERRGP